MRIIALNAPMKSGKDALAEIMVQKYGAVHMEIKELLFEVAIRAAGVTKTLWDALYTREYKEIPTPYLSINGVNCSPREWMIHCSEGLMKPVFGDTVFGDALRKKLEVLQKNHEGGLVVVLSDGGFVSEALPNMDLVGVEKYYLARIRRLDEDGYVYGWGNDSRRYLYAKDFGFPIRAADWDNHPGKLIELADQIWADAHRVNYVMEKPE